jgi:hypothetical protein
MSLKNPVTPSGIDPGTVRLGAQRLNHYATQAPFREVVNSNNSNNSNDNNNNNVFSLITLSPTSTIPVRPAKSKLKKKKQTNKAHSFEDGNICCR